MLTREDNELLTSSGPETPLGKLLRKYWQPVAVSEEMPLGVAPKPVTVMHEKLVLFRDKRGRPGLMGLHCPHRAMDLSFGRVEEEGLRCIYHGWLFDVRGNCLDQPAEPEGSHFKDGIKHLAYPVHEVAGVIFAYMGPGEPPLFPAYPFTRVPLEHTFVRKYLQNCNYLQGNEGNLDPTHLHFLHQRLGANGQVNYPPRTRIEVEETDFGLRIMTGRDIGDGKRSMRMTNFVYPNLCSIPVGEEGQNNFNFHVPIDDTHHCKYMLTVSVAKPLNKEALKRTAGEVTADYRTVRNRENRYLQDRQEMETQTWAGLGYNFIDHDTAATESEGLIQDRTQEHLGYSDKALAASRRLLLQSVRGLQQGAEPPHLVRRPEQNDFSHLIVVSEDAPLEEAENWDRFWDKRLPQKSFKAATR